MEKLVVQVPASVLLDPDQTPTTKVVWIATRLYPAANPAELAARTSLDRKTVLAGLSRITGWNRSTGGLRVNVPGALLGDGSVGAQAKVLYGLLQTTPNYRGQAGQFTYADLASLTRLSRNTLKRAMADLVRANWVQVSQKNQVAPIHFTLGTPAFRRSLEEADLARRRLSRARFGGEAIMQEYLSLLIDSPEFTDNARPGFLINPLTGERLELDRFYPPNLAFEYHGAQHDRETAQFSRAQVDAQRLRDLIKAGLCLYQGIQLIIIRAEDLSLQGISDKLSQVRSLQLRSLKGHEPLIDVLEDASLRYRAEAFKSR